MFGDLTLQLAWDNPLLLGILAAIAIPLWLAYLLRPRPSPPSFRERVAAQVGDRQRTDIDRMLHWLPADAGGERRRAARRAGPPTAVRVTVVPTSEWVATAEGLVLDRSAEGLCVAVERPYREGDEVYLWVEGAAADFEWVAVVVRNCRDCGGYVLLGCEFLGSPPLAVRLQFG